MTCRPVSSPGPWVALVLALLTLAGCATAGRGPAADNELAALYLAADQGHPQAQLRLAQLYGRGDYGLVRDYALALHWLQRAAANGVTRAQETYDRWTTGERARQLVIAALGAHAAGHPDHALPLLRRLAKENVPEAAYALGRIQLKEANGPAQRQRARFWLQAAADAGDANARYLLGTLDAKTGTAGNASAAAEHWRSCADQGHAMCQYSLGLLFLNGDGVNEDVDQGRALIRQAAHQGYDKAERWLARWQRYCRGRSDAAGCGQSP